MAKHLLGERKPIAVATQTGPRGQSTALILFEVLKIFYENPISDVFVSKSQLSSSNGLENSGHLKLSYKNFNKMNKDWAPLPRFPHLLSGNTQFVQILPGVYIDDML
jgi:hypothetical protein